MATMSKRSTISDTLRSSGELMPSSDNGRALVEAAEVWYAATAECNRELIGFVSMRLEKDSATFREMIATKNVTDVTAIQSRWVEETFRDYNAEMTKLMAICTKSVNGGRAGV